MKKYLYGFKISARIRAWIERRKGFDTTIRHELVKPDGEALSYLRKHTNPVTLAPLYTAWPDARVAWVVYVEDE